MNKWNYPFRKLNNYKFKAMLAGRIEMQNVSRGKCLNSDNRNQFKNL